jgi:hypothetical protein
VSILTIYSEGKEAALKRLEMIVKGFFINKSKLKDLKGIVNLT